MGCISWGFVILGIIVAIFNIVAGALLIVIGVLLVVFSNQNSIRKEREQSKEQEDRTTRKRGDY
jgi:small neutral amino acid transporter SnatA (MarC family)